MKFSIPMPSKAVLALAAVGLMGGGAAAYVYAAQKHGKPAEHAESGEKHAAAADDHSDKAEHGSDNSGHGAEQEHDTKAPSEKKNADNKKSARKVKADVKAAPEEKNEHAENAEHEEKAPAKEEAKHDENSAHDEQPTRKAKAEVKDEHAEEKSAEHDEPAKHSTKATAEKDGDQSHDGDEKPVRTAKANTLEKAVAEEHPEPKAKPEAKESAKLVTTAHKEGAPHWSYDGEESPENWGELSPEFATCSAGIEQTPINLVGGIKGEVGQVHFSYKTLPLRIINNGHTIQVNAVPGSSITIGGVRYELKQFHFHHPSEHLLDGKAFDMELHLVHKSASGALAVVGVFFKTGTANPQIQKIFDQMPKSKGPEVTAKGTNNPAAMLPQNRAFYRYMGSLTTPPCTEGLTWTVFKDPIEISPAQLKQFADLFPYNARPVQQPNRRFLIETSAR